MLKPHYLDAEPAAEPEPEPAKAERKTARRR
jgi:hypothetical protein